VGYLVPAAYTFPAPYSRPLSLLLPFYFYLVFCCSFIHMCIHCLGHFSTLPPFIASFLETNKNPEYSVLLPARFN
jgi:hypothetical protein